MTLKKSRTLIVICLLLLSAVSTSWTISEGTLDNHECFVSVTAREMLASGDWICPTFNGEPRLQKTPLSYWLVASLARITGRVDEFTARMPSVIFAVLSAAAILYFVNLWLSFRIAVISGAVWMTSVCYIRYSHSARPEMALTFFVLLCFLTFYSAITAKSRGKQIIYTLVFWMSFALGNLAKGPAPLPLVLIPLFFYVAIFRQWRKVFNWVSLAGLVIFLAIVLPWPLAIAHKLNWDVVLWKREFIDRFFGEYARGDYPVYYYFLIIFKYIAPWVVFLPMAIPAPFFRVWANKRPVMLFLWILFVADFAFLTLSGGKRQHYILPLMPAMAILIGILIEDMAFVKKAYSRTFARNVLVGHAAVVAILTVAGCVYLIRTYPDMVAEALILGTAAIIFTSAATVLFSAKKPAVACGVLFTGIVVLVMILYTAFLNPLDLHRCSRDFSRRLAQIVPQSDNLIAYEYVSNKSIHYFGRVVPQVTDKSVLYERYEQGDWIVATADHLEKLQADDGRLRKVYYKQKAVRAWRQQAPGALFHKSAPFVAEEP
ncbi:MAG: glycosyltransferase family 39 protein [Phycisphaerae bacterium]|jgi:4-amino-4-deoxy-L-arabinose transferase-like glycosyltransferase